jgi:hypothetical protein
MAVRWHFSEATMKWRIVGVSLMLAAGSAAAQVQGPGLTLPSFAVETVELTPSIGLRAWVGGRPGLLASDGVVASSMVLADWYPLSSGFRVTGGLAYGSTRVDSTGLMMPTTTGGLGGYASFAAPGTALDIRSSLAQGNPYLGVGWGLGKNAASRLYLTAESAEEQRATQRPAVRGMAADCGADVRALAAGGRSALRAGDVAGCRAALLAFGPDFATPFSYAQAVWRCSSNSARRRPR